ncbi:MAG: hypothetical protein STSR0008_24140 [Ignavibacterium sp.]
MKTLIIIFSSLILSFQFVSCQKDNIINAPNDDENHIDYSEYFDFYPLDIGNYWEYEYYYYNESYFSVEVIGDTTLQDLEYRVLKEIHFNGYIDTIYRFERLDSLTSCVLLYDPDFQKEFKLDSLAASNGETYEGSRFVSREEWHTNKVLCYSIDTVQIFNESLEQKSLAHIGATDLPFYDLAKGLGLIRVNIFRTGGYELRSAIIRGRKYNL